MMSAIAPVCPREGGRRAVGQKLGQPSSYCGQSPWSVKPNP
jgi:hypothetical protein